MYAAVHFSTNTENLQSSSKACDTGKSNLEPVSSNGSVSQKQLYKEPTSPQQSSNDLCQCTCCLQHT
eukprot:1156665-Pelagomonas_calceolata.AAC.3